MKEKSDAWVVRFADSRVELIRSRVWRMRGSRRFMITVGEVGVYVGVVGWVSLPVCVGGWFEER